MESNEAEIKKQNFKKAIELAAWHETGHTVIALWAGMKVKKVTLGLKGGDTWVETDERTMALYGKDMTLAGRIFEIHFGGASVGQVVDNMIEESTIKSKKTCDWVRLGSPSKVDLIAMIEDELRFLESVLSDTLYKVSHEIRDNLWENWSVTNRQLQKIGKAHGLLVK